MTERPTTDGSIAAIVSGRVGDLELAGEGRIALIDDAVRITAAAGEITIRLSALEGVVYRDQRLTLQLRDDVVDVEGSARLAMIAREIATTVCMLPELTRPLRGLGSRRGRPGSEHDRFFSPLLTARRRCERAADPPARLRAFDAAAIRGSLNDMISTMARERYPKSAPDRRALEAELLEIAEPLMASLDELDGATRRATGPVAGGERGFVYWRSWCSAVRDVFKCADSCWLAYGPVLAAAPPPARRPLWRRMLRLGVVFLALV
jgi:hypothetical protein